MLDSRRLEAERSALRSWGEVIRRYRQWKQLSRRELALRAGLSPVFLGEIERGEKDPSSHTLSLIAEALDVSLAELYLRVAARLERREGLMLQTGQTALPIGVREGVVEYLDAVPSANDETAFDLYTVARGLQTDIQAALLALAQTLALRGSIPPSQGDSR